MGCGDEKLSKYLTQAFTAHCNAMICQQVTLSGDAEWPKVADAVIEAEGWNQLLKLCKGQAREIQELRGAGLHISEPYTSHTWCLLSWEAQYTIIGINSGHRSYLGQCRWPRGAL